MQVDRQAGKLTLALPDFTGSNPHPLVISDLGKAQLPGRCRIYTTALGTREIRAPELAARDIPRECPSATSQTALPPLHLSPAQDVYSLGCIAHELICPAAPLYTVAGKHEMMRRIAAGTSHISGHHGDRAVDACPVIADAWLWATAPRPADRPAARAFHRTVSGMLADYVVLRHCHRQTYPAVAGCGEPRWLMARAELRVLARSTRAHGCGDSADAVVVAAGIARRGEVVVHGVAGILEHGSVMPSPYRFDGGFWPSLNNRIEEKIAHLKPPPEPACAGCEGGTAAECGEECDPEAAGPLREVTAADTDAAPPEPPARLFWLRSGGSSGIGWTGFGQVDPTVASVHEEEAATNNHTDYSDFFDVLTTKDDREVGGPGCPSVDRAGVYDDAPSREAMHACLTADCGAAAVGVAASVMEPVASAALVAPSPVPLPPRETGSPGSSDVPDDRGSDATRLWDAGKSWAGWGGQEGCPQLPPAPLLWMPVGQGVSDRCSVDAKGNAGGAAPEMSASGDMSDAVESASSARLSASQDCAAESEKASTAWSSPRSARVGSSMEDCCDVRLPNRAVKGAAQPQLPRRCDSEVCSAHSRADHAC